MQKPPLIIAVICLSLIQSSNAMDPLPQSVGLNFKFVSKVEDQSNPSFSSSWSADRGNGLPWKCGCTNNTEEELVAELECRCFGQEFRDIPQDLDENLHRLTINDADITEIRRDSLQRYRNTLRDVILSNLPELQVIAESTFRNIANLRTLYISHAPQLKVLPGLFEGATTTKFLSLRISRTGLLEIPDLSKLISHSEAIVDMIDLEGNKIKKVSTNSVRIHAHQMILNYNDISIVEDYAFNGSQISTLSLIGNKQLTELEENAFSGLRSLQKLDLSDTSIQRLPVKGLHDLEVLNIRQTNSMKTIPSVYNFKNLQEAKLTHSFHCCAFKYPAQHDPVRYAQQEAKIREFCSSKSSAAAATATHDTGQVKLGSAKKRKKREFNDSDWFQSENSGRRYMGRLSNPQDWTPNVDHLHPHRDHHPHADHSHLNPLRSGPSKGGADVTQDDTTEAEEDLGIFHQTSAEIPENIVSALCGNWTVSTPNVKCSPVPNALNPCEDIMGSDWLRISVWFVVVAAVLGNFCVIIVLMSSSGELTVPRFLMCHLAFADLCMGLYLLLIASMDLHSMGIYFNFAFDWQFGLGCKVAGFLTVFASQLSVFTLTVVTVERWFAITYAMYLTRRIRLGAATKIMVCGWFYALMMASLPLFGINNYSSTSICLPMETSGLSDKVYLFSLLVITGLAFALIVFCYAQIYFSLGSETRHCSLSNEMTVAKKMALLVFTDFACWGPIVFFALTALTGCDLIDITRSKILLVFFYPLNSCANPYLYAIMTAQYRKDFFTLLAKCGFCSKKQHQYTRTSSLPTSNHQQPMALLVRMNGRKLSNGNNNVEDALV